jgi:predicted Zn finger-like uncharacterized protein
LRTEEPSVIAACPQCQTRYRLAREKIGAAGARIRCSKCETVFRVQAPDGPPTAAPVTPQQSVTPPAAAQRPAAQPPPPPAPVEKPQPPLAHAVVAEPDAELGKAIVELLRQWRIAAELIPDGGQALVRMFRAPPDLAVLGAELPSLAASQVSELAQRATELAAVKLVRVTSPSDPPAAPGFDAEEMIEAADLPDGLAEILGRIGVGARPTRSSRPVTPPGPATGATPRPKGPIALPDLPTPPRPATPPRAAAVPPAAVAPTPAPVAAPAAARPAPAPTSSDPDIAAAERLARIAVSDVILYNQDKFAASAARGTAAKDLAGELQEARQHFNSRVAAAVRANRDFLVEELERRAAALRK